VHTAGTLRCQEIRALARCRFGPLCGVKMEGYWVGRIGAGLEPHFEVSSRGSALQESALQESALQESALQESALQESALQESALKESALKESALKESA
jgi:hypothetical protein